MMGTGAGGFAGAKRKAGIKAGFREIIRNRIAKSPLRADYLPHLTGDLLGIHLFA
jgi:hypothetical protein